MSQQQEVVQVRIEAAPNLFRPTLGKHESPKPFFMVRFDMFLPLPKPA